VEDLNRLYRNQPALHRLDFGPAGFEWIDCNDIEHSTISFIRKTGSADDTVLIVCNFTSVINFNYRVGVPRGGFWNELLNSDAVEYGGSGQGNLGGVVAAPIPLHGRPCSITITLPPLATVFFRGRGSPP
jgi:1,4-alpha-glucan branching enzyme